MIKILYFEISLSDSIENQNALCKIIVRDTCRVSKKSKKSVLRHIKILLVALGILLSVYINISFYCLRLSSSVIRPHSQ